MKAIIDPTTSVKYISAWVKVRDKYYPVETELPYSARVCQVEPDADIFPVAEPLFWEDCPPETIADVYYFETETKQFILVPQAPPYPSQDQPVSTGTQTV